MKYGLLLLVASLIACKHAVAANWVDIGGNDSVVVSVDTQSLRRTGTKVKSWLKWEWAKPTDVPNTFPVKHYRLERQLQVSDCKNRTLAIAQGIRYTDPEGNEIVDSYTVPEKSWEFSEAAPETMGDSIIKYVCSFDAKARR